MRDLSFAEILKNVDTQFESEIPSESHSTRSHHETNSTLDASHIIEIMTTISPLKSCAKTPLTPHSYSLFLTRVKPAQLKLKAENMTAEQFAAYESLLYAMELPILAAHKLFPESFTPEQLKKAYKIAAMKRHPDTGGSHETFLQIKKHYELLAAFAKTRAHDKATTV